MRILLPYYSRSGHTETLALVLAAELRARGHDVALEKIAVEAERSKWRLALPLLSTLPVLPLYLWVPRFRRWWLTHYSQAEQTIKPLSFPSAARFDCVCIGGPKWLYIAYPIARYLRQIDGLAGKPVSAFATFCGPPLKVFELEMLFAPIQRFVADKHAKLVSSMAVSSRFHEFFFFNEMEYVFRLISRIAFGRSLETFTLESHWGKQEVQRFCDALLAQSIAHNRSLGFAESLDHTA